MIAIQTANLTKKYGDIIAINGVDLEVEAGEIVGCLGPERSGKTTLLRLLTGLVRPTLGDSTVLGLSSVKLEKIEFDQELGPILHISGADLMNETPRDKVDNHGVLGITGMSVSEEAAKYYGVPEGVLVSEVTDGGAADKAGIKEKTIITEFDGKRIRSIEELVSRLEYYEPGEEVDVTIEVADGDSYKEKTVTVTLGENSEKNQDSDDDSKEKPDQEEPDDQDNDVQDGEDDGSTDSLLRDFLENGMSYEHYHNVW